MQKHYLQEQIYLLKLQKELSNLGLSVEKARRGFAQVRTIQQQALAQGRDVPSVQDILEGTELGQQEELSTVMNIMNQQQTQSSVSLGAVQGQTGAVTGLFRRLVLAQPQYVVYSI